MRLTAFAGVLIWTIGAFAARAAARAVSVSSASNSPSTPTSLWSAAAGSGAAGVFFWILARHPGTRPDGASVLGRFALKERNVSMILHWKIFITYFLLASVATALTVGSTSTLRLVAMTERGWPMSGTSRRRPTSRRKSPCCDRVKKH